MRQYDVGYKKPPKSTQFKPGNRAGGRKKNLTNERAILRSVINSPFESDQQGMQRRISRMQRAVDTYYSKALRGDVEAADMLLKFAASADQIGDINPVRVYMTESEFRA